jgi:ribosomal 30S subunit maturation factor RimM
VNEEIKGQWVQFGGVKGQLKILFNADDTLEFTTNGTYVADTNTTRILGAILVDRHQQRREEELHQAYVRATERN